MNERIPNQAFFESKRRRVLEHPPVIVAEELTSVENMGAILRLADNVGCEQVYFVNEIDEIKMHKLKKTAVTSFDKIKFEIISFDALDTILPSGFTKIAVDTSKESKDLFEIDLPEKVIYLFGSERYGMTEKMLNYCDDSVYIPLGGQTFSVNVSHAVAVVLFEHLRRFGR